MPGACSIHPSAAGRERCARCQKSFCDECWISRGGVIYCRACAASRSKAQQLGAAAVVLLSGGAIVATSWRAAPPAPVVPPGVSYRATLDLRLDAAPASVRALALSPDGQTLASASEDGQVSLWDARSGAPMGTLSLSEGSLSALVFASGRLVAAAEDGTLYFYDLKTRTQAGAHKRHVSAITGLSAVPGSDLVVSVGSDGLALLWDAKQAALVRPIDALERGLLAVAVSPGGDRVAVAGKPGADGSAQLSLYETAARPEIDPREVTDPVFAAYLQEQGITSKEIHHKIADLKVADPSITALAFSPDGTRLAFAGVGSGVRERDLSANVERIIAPGVSSRALVYLPDGRLAIASQDGRLLLAASAALTAFTPVSSDAATPPSQEPGPIRGSAHFPNGAATPPTQAEEPGAASMPAPPALTELRQPAPLQALALGPDRLYFAGDAPSLWSSPLGVLAPTRLVEKAHPGRARDLALLSGGGFLVASSTGIYRYTAGSEPTLSDYYPSGDTHSLSASRDGLYLGLVSDCAARCWVDLTRKLNQDAAEVLERRLLDSGITPQLQRVPEGVTLRVLGVDKPRADLVLAGVGLIAPDFQGQGAFSFATDRADGLRLDTGGIEVTDVAFSPRELTLAASLSDGRVMLFSAGDPRPAGVLGGGNQTPLQALYSPDGTTLAVAHRSGEVVLWDVKTRARLRSVYAFNGTPTEPEALAFSPDGKWLAVSNRAAELMRFEVATGDRRGEVRLSEPQAALAFSVGGEVLASSSGAGEVSLLDGSFGGARTAFQAGGTVSALSFGSDGRLYAAGFFPSEHASLLAWTLRPE